MKKIIFQIDSLKEIYFTGITKLNSEKISGNDFKEILETLKKFTDEFQWIIHNVDFFNQIIL